jgi:dUTP pyrophosphatase
VKRSRDPVGCVVSGSRIRELLKARPPLVENMVDPGLQVQENGVELTVREVHRWSGLGAISLRNEERQLANSTPLAFDETGWLLLPHGSYRVIYNEIVSIPKDLIAVGRPRSSLLRCGATIASAVWDAGYSGRGESLLLVHNPDGLRLQKDARVLQLLFFRLAETVKKGYRGVYQKENM